MRLVEIAAVFFRIGVLAVGGPVMHVALMRREVVVKRRWLDEKAFYDAFAACQLIPGPSSTELAILLGYRRAGIPGLLTAGGLFILPAMVIMLGLAVAYQHFGSTTVVVAALRGVRPVVVAVIVWALIDLGRRIITGPVALLLGVAVVAAGLLGINPILLLIAGGLLLLLQQKAIKKSLLPLGGWGTLLSATVNMSLVAVFLTFLKYGAVSFGSGYVLFALLRSDVVDNFHWLTTSQLVDAIAISQATPGPVSTVATFIGYLVAGTGGALVATAGIFLPGFLLVPFVDRITRLVSSSSSAAAFLDGVNIAALGLVATVAIQLGRLSLVDATAIAVALVAFLVLLRAPLLAPLLVLAGALLGLIGFR